MGDLIVLENVYSNYTHTSPSLLDALSFPLSFSDESVWQQPRISVVKVLKNKAVSVAWLSNQNRAGSANYASTILTRAVDFKKWSRDFSIVPNASDFEPRVFDHDFVKNALLDVRAAYSPSRRDVPLVTFIHFYAGHDPYLEMIPEAYRASIDSKLEDSANPEALLGKVYNGQYRIKEWNDYDTAVRYVDAGSARVDVF
jgi:glucan phosphoethanolaminetransferase (alkaline phosphatase superfamily)